MEVTAKTNYLRIAPRKVRLVANILKGLSARDAALQLRFLPKRASRPIEKLLHAAISNAKHNFSLDEKNLRVKSVTVDGGPVLKRFRARAFGRASRIIKRTSHVTLILDEVKPTRASTRRKKKSDSPELRLDVTPEEMKNIAKDEVSEASQIRREDSKKNRPARGGFTQRIFNRKAV